jgi:hypothetical protein
MEPPRWALADHECPLFYLDEKTPGRLFSSGQGGTALGRHQKAWLLVAGSRAILESAWATRVGMRRRGGGLQRDECAYEGSLGVQCNAPLGGAALMFDLVEVHPIRADT